MKQSFNVAFISSGKGSEGKVSGLYFCEVFLESFQIFILERIVVNVPLSAGVWCNGPFQEKLFANFAGGVGDFARRIFPFHDRKKRKRA